MSASSLSQCLIHIFLAFGEYFFKGVPLKMIENVTGTLLVTPLPPKLSKHFKHPIKRNIFGQICVFCRRDFQTRSKLVQHIHARSARCFALWQTLPDMDEQEYISQEASTAAEERALKHQGLPSLFSTIPTIRIPGPLIQEISGRMSGIRVHARDKEHDRVSLKLLRTNNKQLSPLKGSNRRSTEGRRIAM